MHAYADITCMHMRCARVPEIHGAWFDPANPVVPMSGSLRADLFEDLLAWERSSELCLALGTSLSGMNADRVVEACARRAQQVDSTVIGAVIVNLQQTRLDAQASLRIFARLDVAMRALAVELALPEVRETLVAPPLDATERHVFDVPYAQETGELMASGERSAWNLEEGAVVRVTGGLYAGDVGVVVGRQREGHYKLQVQHAVNAKLRAKVALVLGHWFVSAAQRGALARLPVVNTREPNPFEA